MALQVSWMQAASGDTEIPYDAQQDRAAVLGSVFSREGVLDLRGGHLKVSQRGAGPNMSVDIAVGRGSVFGDDASDQGPYVITNTTPYNVTVPAAPGSGTRTHRIVGRVRDRRMNASWAANTYDWLPVLLPDTGSGTPAVPATAIPLGRVVVPAGTVSITTAANILDDRIRGTVGTPAVEGLFGALYEGFIQSDATRPLRWSVNPDGWVQLSGWVRWNLPPSTYAAGLQQTMGGTSLADPAVKPPGIRDFPGTSVFGAVHYAVFPSGTIYFRFPMAVTLTTSSWFSFDGCFYKI